ncbi:MAG: iron-sulfur cluster assembly accessory protein [Burkholderiales bacterium]|nr:iron-sulfur cluster assembly accessory protein [Burkholderiales bacterium]
MPNMTLTPAALKFIARMVRFSTHPTGGLRLTVTPGGCSGYSSQLAVEAQPREGDADLRLDNGARLFLPAESRLVLDGLVVDFAETPTSAGLTFTNPNAAPCACSSSGAGAGAAPGVGVTSVPLTALARRH